MKRYAALFTLLVLLLAGCGIEEVDITNMPPATAAASAAPSLEPAATPESTPSEMPLPDLPADEMVKLVDIIPDIYTDLRYATEDNFTGGVYTTLRKFTCAIPRYKSSPEYRKG